MQGYTYQKYYLKKKILLYKVSSSKQKIKKYI